MRTWRAGGTIADRVATHYVGGAPEIGNLSYVAAPAFGAEGDAGSQKVHSRLGFIADASGVIAAPSSPAENSENPDKPVPSRPRLGELGFMLATRVSLLPSPRLGDVICASTAASSSSLSAFCSSESPSLEMARPMGGAVRSVGALWLGFRTFFGVNVDYRRPQGP